MLARRPRYLPHYIVIAAGMALRIAITARYSPAYALFSDPGRHWELATKPLDPNPMSAIDPVVFHVWLGAVAKLTAGDPTAITFYAALLSCLNVWLWYRFAREALRDKGTALIATALIAFLPEVISIYSYHMMETLLLPLVGLSFWMSWRAMRLQTTASVLWATALWTIACLTKLNALPIAAMTMMYVIWKQPSATWISRGAASVALMILLSIPSAYRAHTVLGIWTPVGLPRMNQIYWESGAREVRVEIYRQKPEAGTWNYFFIIPSMDEFPLAPLSNWTSSREGIVYVKVDVNRGARDWNTALLRNVPGPARLFRLWEENFVFLFWGKAWPTCNMERGLDRLARHLRWIWLPMFLVLSAALVRFRRASSDLLLPIVLCCVTWLAFVILPAVPMEGRFRMVLEPLTVCALVQVAILFRDMRLRAP